MILLPDISLPAESSATLAGLQQIVDDMPTYDQKVFEGKRLFDTKRRSVPFRPIINSLKAMTTGARRCCYCEDSQATDIEHIWPKDYFPNLVFAWENYLFSCSRCNRPKSNQCDVYLIHNGQRVSVSQMIKQHGGPPPAGDPVLINPRLENPLDFMILDLSDTFFFNPLAEPNTQQWERARHTIDLLKLNEEDVLPKARQEAFHNYRDRLEKYITEKSKDKPLETLQRIQHTLQRMGHPTVWQEMKRQSMLVLTTPSPLVIREIKTLFDAAPEAMVW